MTVGFSFFSLIFKLENGKICVLSGPLETAGMKSFQNASSPRCSFFLVFSKVRKNAPKSFFSKKNSKTTRIGSTCDNDIRRGKKCFAKKTYQSFRFKCNHYELNQTVKYEFILFSKMY